MPSSMPLRPRPRAPRVPRAVQRFAELEASSGIVLVAAAVLALAWANSPWHESYEQLWGTHLGIGVGDWRIEEDLRHWVNDGLMALFFLVVGLEIKRELTSGDLREWRTAAVPVLAATGGMVVPAAIFVAVNAGQPGSGGWAIPTATDIAFALGVLALVGRRAHPALKLFLLTLAVVDDIGAILVIAVFYAEEIQVPWLVGAGALLGAMALAHRLGVRILWVHVLLGVAVWVCTFESGVHATIAGVALGLLAAARSRSPRGDMPIAQRLERRLHPWTSFAIVPLFALANSGVRLDGIDLGAPGAKEVAGGVFVALVAGKLLGVTGAAWLAVRVGVGRLPEGFGTRDLLGGAACAGIGFTVSLFVAGLAFEDAALVDAAKVGVLAASVTAAVLGAVVLAGGRDHRTSGVRPGRTRSRIG